MTDLQASRNHFEMITPPGDDTIFVLGNGPSLARTSLPELSQFATIGMNSAYRYWKKIDWRPSYYACLDTVVGLSHKEAISQLIAEQRIKKFLLRSNLIAALGDQGKLRNIINFDAEAGRNPTLSALPVTTGSHAMLWAATLGYKQVVLLGVDLKYTEVVPGAVRRDGIELEIVEKAKNPNYFFDDYQQPGDKYNLPNPRPDLHFSAWREAALMVRQQHPDTIILQGNSESAIQFFPVISIEDFRTGKATPVPPKVVIKPPTSSLPRDKPLSSEERLASFLRTYSVVIAVLALLIAAFIYVIGPALFTEADTASIAAYCALGLSFFGLLLSLYSRKAILDHLHALDHDMLTQKERLRDLERLLKQ